ncbi:MAG: tRNA (adenosine(37)-N6)-threonylcarbamoyltransferase complex ATPase subunit type 1 TsaE [Patescibacteria group bacterium]
MEFITQSAEETKNLGKTLAADLAGYEVFALSGDLGSGKTTFVQGFAEGLGISSRIISPTFILMRKYKVGDKNFYHIDLYRLEGNIENEVINLGLGDIWEKPENIVVIEWAEKIKEMISESAKWIKFENLGGDSRKIII